MTYSTGPTISSSPHPRGQYRLTASLWVPQPLEEVFSFFADAHQLETITPPWLHFQVLTPAPIDLHVGQLIDYKLQLHGIPIRWRTLISTWEPPYRFVDEQLRGPYRLWHHEHRFTARDGGTLVEDIVDYAVPGGAPIHWLLVKGDVLKIFKYREQVLRDIFGVSSVTADTSR